MGLFFLSSPPHIGLHFFFSHNFTVLRRYCDGYFFFLFLLYLYFVIILCTNFRSCEALIQAEHK